MSIPKHRIAEIITTHSPDLAPERVASLAEALAGMKEFSAPPEITLEALPPQEVPGMRDLLLRKGVQAAEQVQSKEDPFRSAELRFLRYFDLASPEPKEPPAQIPLAPPPAERPAVPPNLTPELRVLGTPQSYPKFATELP